MSEMKIPFKLTSSAYVFRHSDMLQYSIVKNFFIWGERQSHPAPDRGRAPTSELMVEWS